MRGIYFCSSGEDEIWKVPQDSYQVKKKSLKLFCIKSVFFFHLNPFFDCKDIPFLTFFLKNDKITQIVDKKLG